MPEFVILEHDHPVLHWDLMLDTGTSLRTWRLASFPVVPSSMPAESLVDHRREYLTYEGPVSNDRGHVRRVASGMWTLIAEDSQSLRFRLESDELEAVIVISPPSGRGVAAFSQFDEG